MHAADDGRLVAQGVSELLREQRDLLAQPVRQQRRRHAGAQPLERAEGAFGGQPQAFYDLFRLENGLIVEHWDVIAPMPGPDAKHNEAGKF